ncbi:MAG: dGTP triphosphohydrolase [Bacteroidota bacterium]
MNKHSLYSLSDSERLFNDYNAYKPKWRSEFWRDYARLIHSPAFRRLKGKTQLFPGEESDFFRNRLTHSIEVAQIAKSIVKKINYENKLPNGDKLQIDEDIVEFASLAHDLGHPPFGHQGELALDELMIDDGGFEGNAQTLRILTKLEKKVLDREFQHGIDENGNDVRVGLNLTPRSIASILKYDRIIPTGESERKELGFSTNKPVKGYYKEEAGIIQKVKSKILRGKSFKGKFKTIECSIMDIADDIAYSNYDLEDAFKAGFIHPMDLLFPKDEILLKVEKSLQSRISKDFTQSEILETLLRIYENIFKIPDGLKDVSIDDSNFILAATTLMRSSYKTSKLLANNGFFRTAMTSSLVGKFIEGVEFHYNEEYPALSKVKIENGIYREMEILKTFTYELQISSPRLKIVEYRGKEIIKKIFHSLNNDGFNLLPDDLRKIYNKVHSDKSKKRVICDFIAGMTDRYAIEFYGRLTSEQPETIFKPF